MLEASKKAHMKVKRRAKKRRESGRGKRKGVKQYNNAGANKQQLQHLSFKTSIECV